MSGKRVKVDTADELEQLREQAKQITLEFPEHAVTIDHSKIMVITITPMCDHEMSGKEASAKRMNEWDRLHKQAVQVALEFTDYAVTIIRSKVMVITLTPIDALRLPHFSEPQHKLVVRFMEMMAVARRGKELTRVGTIPAAKVREVFEHMKKMYPKSKFDMEVLGESSFAAYRIQVDNVGSFF